MGPTVIPRLFHRAVRLDYIHPSPTSFHPLASELPTTHLQCGPRLKDQALFLYSVLPYKTILLKLCYSCNQLILEEQCSLEEGATGPCLEYLLQHHILDLLATLACTDSPPGMKSLTLCFMKKLLTQLREPVLPHVSVYAPVQRLVAVCSGLLASPSETDEIHFLCTLCAVIGKHPHLINIFNSQYVETKRLSVSSTTSSQSSGFEDFKFPPSPQYRHNGNENLQHPLLSREDALEQTKPELMTETFTFQASPETKSPNWGSTNKFPLLDALLSFLHSADSRVTVKACEGIMLLAALPSDSFARSLARHSNLCAELAARLAALYEGIVPDVDPNDIDEMQITWGLDSLAWTDGTKFLGCRQVAAFLAWLDYFDQFEHYISMTSFLCRNGSIHHIYIEDNNVIEIMLVREAHPITGTTLAESFRSQFLEGVLGPTLLETGSSTILVTAFITKCLKQVTAPALLQGDQQNRIGVHSRNRLDCRLQRDQGSQPC
uniref:Protein FAM160B1 n=1 Tax=Timema poppense TaxID=170557 RepID=A0A7R9D8Z8_TIMPO|nr:unnamed protein product [Timema poppensis]